MRSRRQSTVVLIALLTAATGCATKQEKRQRNTGDGGFGPMVTSVLVGPRAGYEMNEGRRVCLGEWTRAIPYVGLIPRLMYGLFAFGGIPNDSHNRTAGLVPISRDVTATQVIDLAHKHGTITATEVREMWRDMVKLDYVNYRLLRDAKERGFITEDEYDRHVKRIVERIVAKNRWSPAADPLNTGVLHEAMTMANSDTESLRAGLQILLIEEKYPDPETIEAAIAAGVLDPQDAKTLASHTFLATQQRLNWRLHKLGFIGDSEYRTREASTKARLKALEPDVKAVRKGLKAKHAACSDRG